MTLDDFEWVEKNFDQHALIHKTHELTVAIVDQFNGWYVKVLKAHGAGVLVPAENIDNFEAAKVIATIHVNQYMEGYPDVNVYSKRAPKYRPEAVPKGVFKVD